MLSCCLSLFCMMPPITGPLRCLSRPLSFPSHAPTSSWSPCTPPPPPSSPSSSHFHFFPPFAPSAIFLALSGSTIGDFKLPPSFIIKPPLCCHCPCCLLQKKKHTHGNMQTHMQAHASMQSRGGGGIVNKSISARVIQERLRDYMWEAGSTWKQTADKQQHLHADTVYKYSTFDKKQKHFKIIHTFFFSLRGWCVVLMLNSWLISKQCRVICFKFRSTSGNFQRKILQDTESDERCASRHASVLYTCNNI